MATWPCLEGLGFRVLQRSAFLLLFVSRELFGMCAYIHIDIYTLIHHIHMSISLCLSICTCLLLHMYVG